MPDSYFNAGFIAIVNALTTSFAVKVIENLFLLEKIENLGPTAAFKNHFLLMAMVYIPLLILETLAISLSARIRQQPALISDSFQKFVFGKAYLIFPIIFIIATSVGFSQMPKATRIAIITGNLLNISAFEEAQKYLDAGIEEFPEDPQLCSLKSQLLNKLSAMETPSLFPSDNDAEALKYAEKASNQKPNSPIYKLQLCRMLNLNLQFDQALIVASQAVSLDPKDPYLWQYLGDLNLKFYNNQEAIYSYKKALDINPDNSVVLNNLAYTLLSTDEKNESINAAIEFAKRSIELMPSSMASRDTLAWAYYKQKRYTEALETIEILYRNQKEISPEIDFHYAAILNEMRLLNNPEETFDKMLVKPEVLINSALRNQIIEVRQKAAERNENH